MDATISANKICRDDGVDAESFTSTIPNGPSSKFLNNDECLPSDGSLFSLGARSESGSDDVRQIDSVILESRAESASAGSGLSRTVTVVFPDNDIRARIVAAKATIDLFAAGNDFVVIPDNVVYRAGVSVPGKATYLHFPRSLYDAAFRDVAPDTPPVLNPAVHTHDPILRSFGAVLFSEYEEPISPGYARRFLQAIIAHVARRQMEAAAVSGRSLTSRQMMRIKEEVQRNITGKLNVPQLAACVNMSPDHFRRVFKVSAGVSPQQFIMAARVEVASRLLTETPLKISEIAQEAGFADQVHLTRVFRNMRGVTPAALRRMARA